MVLKFRSPAVLVCGGVLAVMLILLAFRMHSGSSAHAASAKAPVPVASAPLPPGPASGEYETPAQVPGVKPCPKLGSRSEVIDDHGRQAVEVVVKMNVDVDGAPNAYGPPGKKALDIEAHARAPKSSPIAGTIVGYMTEYEGGPPTVQGKDDPYPGYYVSQTDFADLSNKRMEDPRRYVDATRINYVVEGRVAEQAGVQMGDQLSPANRGRRGDATHQLERQDQTCSAHEPSTDGSTRKRTARPPNRRIAPCL